MTGLQAPREGWSAILWDLDGTLADTVPLILAAYRHTMEGFRGERLPDELWLEHVGRPLRDTLRHFARDDDEAAAMRERYVGFQREAHDRMVRPFPGVVELVTRLRERDVPMAIVTSKAREMAERTRRVCGLDDSLPLMITADDVERGKPHPEPVERALAGLVEGASGRDGTPGDDGADGRKGGTGRGGVPPGRASVLFVGDSPHDIVAGRAASVRTLAVSWGAAPEERLRGADPDALVRDVQAMAGILEGVRR